MKNKRCRKKIEDHMLGNLHIIYGRIALGPTPAIDREADTPTYKPC
jgi:hypothetical protein